MNLLPLLGLLAAWILAVSLVLAAIQVRFRDIGVALPVLLQVADVRLADHLSAERRTGGVARLVPAESMAGIVSSFRDILLRQATPDPHPLSLAVVVTAIALPIAYLFFKRAEATMADVI